MGSFLKINDLGVTFEEFIKAKMKAALPNTDLSDNSPLMDILIYPWVTLASQNAVFGTNIELRTNLSNAADLSDEEIRDIGEGNYFTTRGEGSRSVGNVTFNFESISDIQYMTIPEGLPLTTKTGLRFIVTETISLSPTEMYTKWDPLDMVYKVNVPVQSELPGIAYNVDTGNITEIENSFTTYVVTVTNNSKLTGGTDVESKEAYLARIRSFYSSRTLETQEGYKQQILETFEVVDGVAVIGYGDDLMTRDYADSITVNGVTLTNVHIGGKTDIYLKGADIQPATISFTARTQVLPFARPYAEIDPTSIVVMNMRTMTQVPVENLSFMTISGVYCVKVDPVAQQGDSYRLEFNYDSNDDGTFESFSSQTFLVDKTTHKRKLLAPFVGVLSVVNKTRSLSHSFSGISVEWDDPSNQTIITSLVGTSREKLVFTDVTGSTAFTDSINGDEIEITYSYNKTINDVGAFYDQKENRVVTRDVLIKKATEAYFFIEIEVKLNEGVKSSSYVESAIYNALAGFLAEKPMSSKIDESDIINELYENSETSSMIDYVKLALKTFHKTTNPEEPFVSGVHDGISIQLGRVEYPSLHTLHIFYIGEAEQL